MTHNGGADRFVYLERRRSRVTSLVVAGCGRSQATRSASTTSRRVCFEPPGLDDCSACPGFAPSAYGTSVAPTANSGVDGVRPGSSSSALTWVFVPIHRTPLAPDIAVGAALVTSEDVNLGHRQIAKFAGCNHCEVCFDA
jgi:hypothetical protein